MAEKQEVKAAAGACGFEDKQNTNEGKSTCVLEKGHKGDHSDGKYSFSDAAGVPIPAAIQEKLDAEKEKKKAAEKK